MLTFALAESKSIGDIVLIRDSYKSLAAINEVIGNYHESLLFYEQYIIYHDSILSKDNKKYINELSAKYETAVKEAKIELLSKESELQKANALRKETELKSFRNNIILGSAGLFVMLGSVFFYIRNKRKHEKVKMEKQLIELEHQALRLQMNPHFIFNSLSAINNFIGRNETAEAKKIPYQILKTHASYFGKFARGFCAASERNRLAAILPGAGAVEVQQ